MVQSIEAFCQRVQQGLAEATFEQKRQLIELLIDRVVVTEEEVEIRYVIPTSPTSEQLRFCQLRLDYFDMPADANGPHHLLQRGSWWGEHEIVALFVRISETAADEQRVRVHPPPTGAPGERQPSRRAGALWCLHSSRGVANRVRSAPTIRPTPLLRACDHWGSGRRRAESQATAST